MDEIEKIKYQSKLIRQAMYDSYRIITRKISPIKFLIEKDRKDEDFVLLFDVQDLKTLTKDTLENIIEYFSDLEEYEMCAELVKYKKKRGWDKKKGA
jgi:phosphoserine phosphatase